MDKTMTLTLHLNETAKPEAFAGRAPLASVGPWIWVDLDEDVTIYLPSGASGVDYARGLIAALTAALAKLNAIEMPF